MSSALELCLQDVDDAFALDILANLAAGGDRKAHEALTPFLASMGDKQAYQRLVGHLVARPAGRGASAPAAAALSRHGEMTDVDDLLCAASKLRTVSVCSVPGTDAAAIAIQIARMKEGTNALILHVNQHFMTCLVHKSDKAVVVHLVDTNAVDEQEGADKSSKDAARVTREKATDMLQRAGVIGNCLIVHAAPLQTHAPNACGPLSLGLIKHVDGSPSEPSNSPIDQSVKGFFEEMRKLGADGMRQRTDVWREEMAQARAEAEALLPVA